MAIKITFDQFINDPRVWQAFVNENLAFFNTSQGNALMNQLMDVRKQYRDIEKHIARYPNSTVNWRPKQERIRAQWQGLRGQIWNSPDNPANPASPLNPANAPAAPPVAPAASAAPPVYLPNVNAPNYMFPTAESVRDMTYDPGIGGFLRPNSWQPAAAPPSPYRPTTDADLGLITTPRPGASTPVGPSDQGGTPVNPFGPNVPIAPGGPWTNPYGPIPGPGQAPYGPWQPGY